MKKANNFVDLTEKRFGKLTVQKYLGKSKWLCKCDCGNETITSTRYLKIGHTKSCGCLRKEKCYEMHKINQKYKNIKCDKVYAKLKSIYEGMIERCYDKNSERYKDWGGRSIKVCEEWHNFENFYNWAITSGFDINKKQKEQSIDRIDNNKDYSPFNCRWATAKEQARNKRNNFLIKYNGEIHCEAEWVEILNLSRKKVRKLLCE